METDEQTPPGPASALEIAGAISSFALSLSTDPDLLWAALKIARDAIEADLLSAKRCPR